MTVRLRTLLKSRLLWRLIAVVVVVDLVIVAACWYHLQENFHAVRPNVVYRSAQPDREMLARYQKEHGLKTVVNLRGKWEEEHWYLQEVQAARELGLRYYEVPLLTHRLTAMENLRKLIQIFDECPKPMLLHCRQGADRTSLAAAVYLLLYENKSPAEALEAYQLHYGHTGWAWGHHLPHLFDCYESWLNESGYSHSPDRFREWAHTQQTVGYFASQFEPASTLEPSLTSPWQIVLRATNSSKFPWTVCWPHDDGVHLEVTLYDAKGRTICEVIGGGDSGVVHPGQSLDFSAELPPLEKPGRYRLRGELVDGYGVCFGSMGARVWTSELHIPAETAPQLTYHKSADGKNLTDRSLAGLP